MAQEAIGVGLIGCGTVGSGVVKLLLEQADLYAARLGRPLALRRVLVREQDVAYKTEMVPPGVLTTDVEAFFATPEMPILVELGGGRGVISQFVRRALALGKHVVTANKALLAAEGPELFALARQHEVSIGFEASCGGGIPCVTGLMFGLMANEINALYGILNGTCNYILTEMTREDKDYATALREAQQAGFAEADPTMDVSGGDTAHKLAILASLAFGVQATAEQVTCQGIDQLDLADIRFGAELGYDIKLLGIAEAHADDAEPDATRRIGLQVEPCFVHSDTQLAQVHGPFNALSVYGHAVGHTLSYGRGAGMMPTASAVVSDVMNIASGWYPHAFASLRIWADLHAPAKPVDPDDVVSRFYLRLNALDRPGVIAQAGRVLGELDISISAVLQHEQAAGQFVPVVITTHEAQRGAVRRALKQIEQLEVIEGTAVCIRIVDLPEG